MKKRHLGQILQSVYPEAITVHMLRKTTGISHYCIEDLIRGFVGNGWAEQIRLANGRFVYRWKWGNGRGAKV